MAFCFFLLYRGFDNIKHDLYIPIFWGYKVRVV